MRHHKGILLSLLALWILVQTSICQSRLQSLKRSQLRESLGLTDEEMEGQVDFNTELEIMLQQATNLRSKFCAQSDKAVTMSARGGAECIKLRKTIATIISVTSDLQRIVDSEKICPQPPLNDLLETIQKSPIFEGSRAAPMAFVASRLSRFRKATKIFTTRNYAYSDVGADFHRACDNIPNTLVIIKSGQYIAGGFTEPSWGGSGANISASPDAFFLFSVNRQRIYGYHPNTIGIRRSPDIGPSFGEDLWVASVYNRWGQKSNMDGVSYDTSEVFNGSIELFGQDVFSISEYEVYKLE